MTVPHEFTPSSIADASAGETIPYAAFLGSGVESAKPGLGEDEVGQHVAQEIRPLLAEGAAGGRVRAQTERAGKFADQPVDG